MTKIVYCLKDVKAGFLSPYVAENDAIALRDLQIAVNSENKSVLCSCPEDFELWQLGSYDTETGIITSDAKHVRNVIDLVKTA